MEGLIVLVSIALGFWSFVNVAMHLPLYFSQDDGSNGVINFDNFRLTVGVSTIANLFAWALFVL